MKRLVGSIAVLSAAVLTLGLAAPAMAGDVASTMSPVGTWKTRTDGVAQTITFDKKGHVHGNAGCNNFSGSYTVNGSEMTIGPLATTMMFCEGKMDAEQIFLTKVQATVGYQATAKTLKLFAPKDLTTFRAA